MGSSKVEKFFQCNLQVEQDIYYNQHAQRCNNSTNEENIYMYICRNTSRMKSTKVQTLGAVTLHAAQMKQALLV